MKPILFVPLLTVVYICLMWGASQGDMLLDIIHLPRFMIFLDMLSFLGIGWILKSEF